MGAGANQKIGIEVMDSILTSVNILIRKLEEIGI